MHGNFNVHQVQGTFNGVWTDLVLKQTRNEEGETTFIKFIFQAPAARKNYV